MPERPGIVTTAEDFADGESNAAIVQWTLRFCQQPETLPVFCAWVRQIWPACPYSDQEVLDNMAAIHDIFTAVILGSQ